MEISLLLIALILITAFLYSSVGHGGASGYLAVMSLVGIDIPYLKSSALILNLFVSAIAFWQYYKAGHFNWKIFYPFAIFSIPTAFLGGTILIDPFWYKKILGICLIIAAVRIIITIIKKDVIANPVSPPLTHAAISGAFIGLISGMIGIGGGIILSPLILIMKWGEVKETSGVSALFIFVNSLAGLIGMASKNFSLPPQISFWVIAAIIGGLAGAYWGSKKAPSVTLKNILTSVLLFAAIKLLIT